MVTEGDEESHSMISKGIAPFTAIATGGNSPAHKMVRAMYDIGAGNHLALAEDLMPPGVKATSDIGKTLLTMAWLGGGVTLDESDPSKMRLIIEEGLSLAPQLDKYFTARLAHKTGVLANSYGDPQIHLTFNEMLLNAAIGAPPRELEEIKELSRELKGTGFGRITSPEGEDIKTFARWVFKQDKALLAKLEESPSGNFDIFRKKIKSTREIAKLIYTPKEFQIFNSHIISLRKADSNELVADKFGTDLSNALVRGLSYDNSIVTGAMNTFFMQDQTAFRERVQQGKDLEEANKIRVDQENL